MQPATAGKKCSVRVPTTTAAATAGAPTITPTSGLIGAPNRRQRFLAATPSFCDQQRQRLRQLAWHSNQDWPCNRGSAPNWSSDVCSKPLLPTPCSGHCKPGEFPATNQTCGKTHSAAKGDWQTAQASAKASRQSVVHPLSAPIGGATPLSESVKGWRTAPRCRSGANPTVLRPRCFGCSQKGTFCHSPNRRSPGGVRSYRGLRDKAPTKARVALLHWVLARRGFCE